MHIFVFFSSDFVRCDNVYSWVHSKEIHYSIQLLDTEMEMDAVDEQTLLPMEAIIAQCPQELEMAYTPLFGLDDIRFVDEDSDDEEYVDADSKLEDNTPDINMNKTK